MIVELKENNQFDKKNQKFCICSKFYEKLSILVLFLMKTITRKKLFIIKISFC